MNSVLTAELKVVKSSPDEREYIKYCSEHYYVVTSGWCSIV